MDAKLWATRELDKQCLEFLRTIDLSFTERLCFEWCDPNPGIVEELMDTMGKLGTLVVVNGYACTVFVAMQNLDPQNAIFPLIRRLIVRYDLDICTPWRDIVELVESRAAHGSPLEQVTLTSSFSELLGEAGLFVGLLENISGVGYGLARSTVGWEWWKE